MNTQEVNYFSYFFENSKKDNHFDYGSFITKPRDLELQHWDFITEKGFDKMATHNVIELAKKSGVVIDYSFSYYKTHVGIFVNGNIYICEQHSFTIASCLKTLYFLNIIN